MIKKYLLFLYFFCFYIANSFAQVALLPIGSTSGNAYSGFIANKHSFAYNQELNVLLFGHRGGGGAGSVLNEICFDYSTDNGMTWVPQTAMLNPSVGTYNTRYPQMCIWNPAGNTDIANVKAVSTGPCADGTGWKASYLAVADLPTGVNTNYTFKPIATAIPMAPGSFDYGSFALCNLNGGIGYVAARMDASGSVQTPNYHAVDFWKITPNTTGGFDRTLKFSSIPEACEFSDTASFTYDMAFSPNGNIGYIAHVTADKNAQSCINYSRTPILYKKQPTLAKHG